MPRVGARPAYIGVDPGLSGGIAVIMPAGVLWTVMPEDEIGVVRWLLALKDGKLACRAAVERVWSFGKQGGQGAFTFGRNYGAVRAALCALSGEVPLDPTPQAWMKALGIPLSSKTPAPKDYHSNKAAKKAADKIAREEKGAHKEKLRAEAERRFPGLDLWKCKLVTQRAVCDALLVADYCRLQHEETDG